MCGLYSFKSSPEEARELFGYIDMPNFPPREIVAPTQPIAIVRKESIDRRFALVRWGFVPAWAKEVKKGKPLINARSETIFEKPSFRHAAKRRRCLVPASGFYEWQRKEGGEKQPYFIHRRGADTFAFGGIWETWMGPDGSELETAAIVTTDANEDISPLHHRMPVVVEPDDFEMWLSGEEADPVSLARIMGTRPKGYFAYQPAENLNRPKSRKPAAETGEKASPEEDQMSLFD